MEGLGSNVDAARVGMERWEGTCDMGYIGTIEFNPNGRNKTEPYFAEFHKNVTYFENLCGTYRTLRGAKIAITYHTSAKWTWKKVE